MMTLWQSIRGIFNKEVKSLERWNKLTKKHQVDEIITQSGNKSQLIYKHSFQCGASSYALEQIDNIFEELKDKTEMSFIDVINSRIISNYTALALGVRHESPQVLLIENEQVLWHVSHMTIKSTLLLKKIRE